ncbi:hypothetical protein [Micromonospora sp. DT227]|uniref:hypothetical protein n=1 Tax=Micromonospora sp. DT227 TaxID=3393433 RepID=UPI003CF9CBA6
MKLNFVTQAIHDHGGLVAMVAAAALTAKGEFDLAVIVHYPSEIAWLLPVALDVYLATAAAKNARIDIFIGLLLMMGCQAAVHLLPVFITKGEEVPWGLVVAAVCVPPVIALRTTLGMHGKDEKSPEVLAAEEQARLAAERAAAIDRQRAENAERFRAEREALEAQRQAAETRALEVEAERDAAQERVTVAERKAERAEFRAAQARTQRDGDAGGRRAGASRVERPVTHSDGPKDASVTHPVTHGGDAPASSGDASGDAPGGGDAPAGDASLTREERLTLAVMEAVNGEGVSARSAAFKYGLTSGGDIQAVQRRVRAAKRTEQDPPLARAGLNGTTPDLTNPPQ